jgi:quercetin dioxygenase-like cupin family protein
MSNIDILKEITSNLMDHIDTNFISQSSVKFSSDTGKGNIMSFKLYSQPYVNVSNVFMSEGAGFVKHMHDSKQILAVYEGTLRLHIEGKEIIDLKQNDSYCIDKNIAHHSVAVSDCWFISITMPEEKAFQ